MTIAINGFGRIGRMILRSMIEQSRLHDIKAINDVTTIESVAHLLIYDSVHGRLHNDIAIEDDYLIIDGHKIKYLSQRNPADLPWQELGIDLVLECTGLFTTKEKAIAHIHAGAKKIIISAPASDVDATVVFGVNHHVLTSKDRIISNASCTTNCLAPIVKVLHEQFHIDNGFMTTIHAYTSDQSLLDAPHQNPMRARAANLSMIPSTTGAAKAIDLVLPELAGRINGTAIRVPTPNVSLVNFVANIQKKATIEQVNQAFIHASNHELRSILMVNNQPLVSIDFNHNSASSIIDLHETYMTGDQMVRISAWYDNEWGFACRMVDLAGYIGDIADAK